MSEGIRFEVTPESKGLCSDQPTIIADAPSPPADSQEQLMQWAGAFRDDPDLKAIVPEAYRQRG